MHDVYLTRQFDARLQALGTAADTDPRAASMLRETVRLLKELESGADNGHHPLTDQSAKGYGDLRDCTASEFRSDPSAKMDCRLIWRQFPEQRPGLGPVRELVHVGMRHESPDSYQQCLAALNRPPTQQIPENAPFGTSAYVGDMNEATRTMALDAQRTVALTRQGVAPMATSRPLSESDFGARGVTSSPQRQTAQTLSKNPDGPQP